MRRLVILALIGLLPFLPAAQADEHQLPICTDAEFLAFFNKIVDYQVQFDGTIKDASELRRATEALIANRDERLAQQPACSDAITIQLLLIQLGGDSLARAALELADLPADENPYLTHLEEDQQRINNLVTAMLATDRSNAPPPGQRSFPPCASEDISALDDASAAFLDVYRATSAGTEPSESLAAIERLLLWRQDILPRLPQCAESIDLIHALSAAATDTAAYEAFRYGGVSARANPFPQLVSAGIANVTEWTEQRQIARAAQAASSAGNYEGQRSLPNCSAKALSTTKDALLSAVAALTVRGGASDSIVDALEFSKDAVDFRAAGLAGLPMCAEALDARWSIAEVLADVPVRTALAQGAVAAQSRRLRSAMDVNDLRLESALSKLEGANADGARRANARRGDSAPSCSDGDHIIVFSYLIPKFWQLTDKALRATRPEDAYDLIAQSYDFRRLLWEYLPRCDDALEMGLLMRSIAADTAGSLALELAGAPVLRIPHLQTIGPDMERFFDQISRFYTTCGNINGAAKTYFVVAENIANIRSCASTNCHIVTAFTRGQRLDVVDDMNSWYQIVLPSCETAYIAGFLASQTPPPR
ncbi:MAG: SH3 domain-containing protein [Chloroflexi bacterium]|nr:SH3 domain-containing protein [Chloroflexota bacterium]